MPTNGRVLAALLDQELAQIRAERETALRQLATREADHWAKRRLLAALFGPAAVAFGLRAAPDEPQGRQGPQDTQAT